MEMFCDLLLKCNHSKCQKSLLITIQGLLRYNYSESNEITSSGECADSHTSSLTLPTYILRSKVSKKEKQELNLLLQSYLKKPPIPVTGNISSQLIQDKVKPPARTVPSLSITKSHKSLPRRACLVHHKEQYHLDNNLLSQPRATKYLVKVRTEISPGRFMAKLELHTR